MTVADADAPTLAWSSNMAAANVLSACLGSVDSEVAQYLAACVAQLGPEPGVQDICEQLSPFVPDLLPAERAEALAQQLSVALRVPSEPQPEPELEIQPEPQPEPQLAPQPGAELHPESEPKHRPATAGAQEEVLGQAVTRSLFLGGGGGGGDNDDDGFVVPKRRARRRRSVPQRQVSTPQPLSPQPPPQPQPSPPQPGTPPPHRNASEEIPAPAPASCGTQLGDIACSLAKYGSRKQLRRFAAELGLQADDPGGMVALLRMDSCTVRAAAAATIRGGPDQQAALMAHFQRLAAEGLPTEAAQPGPATIQRVTPAATQGSHGRAGTAAVGSQQRRTAPSECCVECHARTPCELARCGPSISPRACMRTQGRLTDHGDHGVGAGAQMSSSCGDADCARRASAREFALFDFGPNEVYY
eukprot:COSAG01_NODE_130_length_24912_cov_83.574175_5_plen_416_part_00